jgi:phage terminase Nu1 subunit (DNA packaging protein)
MNHRMNSFVSGVLFLSVVSTAGAAAPATTRSADWLPVDQDVWTIMMAEPQAHLLSAQEDLANNDAKGAANEIRMADTFLKIQEKRLTAASTQLNALAQDIKAGKVVSNKVVKDTFDKAISALDHQQAMIPVMAGADSLYMDEADYHLAQAKSHFIKKDVKAAAGDIRKASAYLKMKAVHAGEKAKSELSASAAELDDMAGKVESGTMTAAKDMDEAFARAHKAVRNAL